MRGRQGSWPFSSRRSSTSDFSVADAVPSSPGVTRSTSCRSSTACPSRRAWSSAAGVMVFERSSVCSPRSRGGGAVTTAPEDPRHLARGDRNVDGRRHRRDLQSLVPRRVRGLHDAHAGHKAATAFFRGAGVGTAGGLLWVWGWGLYVIRVPVWLLLLRWGGCLPPSGQCPYTARGLFRFGAPLPCLAVDAGRSPGSASAWSTWGGLYRSPRFPRGAVLGLNFDSGQRDYTAQHIKDDQPQARG